MKLAAVMLLFALAAPSAEIRYFHYERPLENVPQTSGQACLVIDAGVFAHAEPGLADLRLFSGNTETPFVIQTTTTTAVSEQQVKPLNLGRSGGRTVFDSAMPEGSYSDIELSLTGHDFIATVTVTGSQAQAGSKETKLGSYTIFDLTRQKLGRSTVVHLPKSDFRYLHFRIAGPISPENITGISMGPLPAAHPKYVTVAESSSITQKGHSSAIEFTVPANTPVDRILFAPGSAPVNFSRDVTVSMTPIAPPPHTDGSEPQQPATSSGNLLRIHAMQNGRRIDEERLSIEPPEASFSLPSKWIVTIDNGDDAPLTLSSVSLQMLERHLCFDAFPSSAYTLYYGDPALAAPQYDYATLFVLQANAAQARAGPEQMNPNYQPRPDDRPFTEKHPALLWAALALVVALLGFIAIRTAKTA